MKTALVCGAGGFIGGHLVKRLLEEKYNVVAVDTKHIHDWFQVSFGATNHDCIDLRDKSTVNYIFKRNYFYECYQLAAWMGGANVIFTGDNDYQIMNDSAAINLNIVNAIVNFSVHTKVFFSSSARVYSKYNQLDPNNPKCNEDSAYPVEPDSDYGFEKLFSERLYFAAARNHKIDVRVARFHNIFGPYGSWEGGKEKAPAALCRKVIESNGEIEIWGPGTQTRSFLYIDECIEAIRRFMQSSFIGPLNIGSEEMISINDLALMISKIENKQVSIINIPGPVGVNGRNSDNGLLRKELQWEPTQSLYTGLQKTYAWIKKQINSK